MPELHMLLLANDLQAFRRELSKRLLTALS